MRFTEEELADHVDVGERILLVVGMLAVMVKGLHSLAGDLNGLGLGPSRAEHNRTHYPDNTTRSFSSGDFFEAFAMTITSHQTQTENCARNDDTRQPRLNTPHTHPKSRPTSSPTTETGRLRPCLIDQWRL